jgi:tRNA(Ser,Leu) C12 N-acetylase TAN1
MESIQNQLLKGNKSKSEIDLNHIERGSNRKPKQNGIKPTPRVGEMSQTENRNRMKSNRKPIQNEIKSKQRVEMYQTENRNRMESIQNQLLKFIKPKIEMEWNQTVERNQSDNKI